jgi:DinB superfamily/Pentapeptide repeats (8 copies)
MVDFLGDDLSGARFERVNLSDAQFHSVTMKDTRFRGLLMDGVVMRGVELADVEIHGEIGKVRINGVDIGELLNAELDRLHPGRAAMRPTEPAGFRHAWDLIEQLWTQTVERARGLDPELLHASVDDEWSFIETLRHLVFATDAWIRRVVLGDPSPWDSLDLPWDEMPDTPGIPRDRAVRPSLDAVLELRRDRMSTVREVVDGLTAEKLDSDTEPVVAPGWPPSRSFVVRECLRCILNEEWEHRLYAERDLTVLEKR